LKIFTRTSSALRTFEIAMVWNRCNGVEQVQWCGTGAMVWNRCLQTTAREPTPAGEAILSIMKKQYVYEIIVGLVECSIFRNDDIPQDVRPSSCCVIA